MSPWETMASVIEMLANKKRPAVEPLTTILPVLHKEHEGACGDDCACGKGGDEGGCCGG